MEKGKTLLRLLDFAFVPSSFFRLVQEAEKQGGLEISVFSPRQAYSAAIAGEAARLMVYSVSLAAVLNYYGVM